MWPLKTKWDCYAWLLAHPGWHYGLELVAAGVTSRYPLYVRLGQLEELGLVERRLAPHETNHPTGALPRRQYRAVPKP